jgi:hypothetical protein
MLNFSSYLAVNTVCLSRRTVGNSDGYTLLYRRTDVCINNLGMSSCTKIFCKLQLDGMYTNHLLFFNNHTVRYISPNFSSFEAHNLGIASLTKGF